MSHTGLLPWTGKTMHSISSFLDSRILPLILTHSLFLRNSSSRVMPIVVPRWSHCPQAWNRLHEYGIVFVLILSNFIISTSSVTIKYRFPRKEKDRLTSSSSFPLESPIDLDHLFRESKFCKYASNDASMVALELDMATLRGTTAS